MFTFDRTINTGASDYTFYRCESGADRGRWAVARTDGAIPGSTGDEWLWVVAEQVVTIHTLAILLVAGSRSEDVQTLLVAPADAIALSAALNLQLRVADRLYQVTDLGNMSEPEALQLAHPDGTLVTAGDWLRDSRGNHARYVGAERIDGDIVVTVDAGGSEATTAPASAYQLRLH